ncbi:MAG TPA: hypothetical protein VLR93_01400 [Patescibacteria group bacterium]|nr:hypothetical protein [Patescibacteria group bacterium]
MDVFDRLAAIDDRYASRPVAEAFDWSSVAASLPVGGEWYLVAFRSIRRSGADEARLCAFDDRAHAEAAAAPGFVHYYRGPTMADGRCLSFCLWASRADARTAAVRPAHREAVALIDEMYERYTLEFLRVSRTSDAPELRFEPYETGAATDLASQPLSVRPAPA